MEGIDGSLFGEAAEGLLGWYWKMEHEGIKVRLPEG
jgi:hypothetical protein